MSHKWVVVKDKSRDHWLEMAGKIEGGDTWRYAVVRWDGCVHFNSYSNVPLEMSADRKDPQCCDDYIHICDIDEMISDLQEIKRIAMNHFGEWPR